MMTHVLDIMTTLITCTVPFMSLRRAQEGGHCPYQECAGVEWVVGTGDVGFGASGGRSRRGSALASQIGVNGGYRRVKSAGWERGVKLDDGRRFLQPCEGLMVDNVL
jgi:hypothetical protein